MPLVLPKNLVRLTFDPGHDLEGLVVMMRALSTDGLYTMLDMVERMVDVAGLTEASVNADPSKVKGIRSKIEPLTDLFAAHLVSWDLEVEADEEGQPPVRVPATREGIGTLEIAITQKLIAAWYTRVRPTSPDSDLGKGSPSGVTFPEGSLPMAPLSHDLRSLTVPA